MINKSVAKAIAILDLFQRETPALSLKAMAAATNRASGSIMPVVKSLEAGGYLRRDSDSRKYRLGLAFLSKSAIVLTQLDIRNIAQPFLFKLLEQTNENVHLGILDGWEILCVDRKEASAALMIRSHIGSRVPSHCTAMGKAALAFLEEEQLDRFFREYQLVKLTEHTITEESKLREELAAVRLQGYAVDDEEQHPGGMCIAVAVRNAQRKVVASVSVSFPKVRASQEKMEQVIKATRDATCQISRSLGWQEE